MSYCSMLEYGILPTLVAYRQRRTRCLARLWTLFPPVCSCDPTASGSCNSVFCCLRSVYSYCSSSRIIRCSDHYILHRLSRHAARWSPDFMLSSPLSFLSYRVGYRPSPSIVKPGRCLQCVLTPCASAQTQSSFAQLSRGSWFQTASWSTSCARRIIFGSASRADQHPHRASLWYACTRWTRCFCGVVAAGCHASGKAGRNP